MSAIAAILETAYFKCMDAFFARWPGPAPSSDQLRQCRLISHRGEHDNRRIKENTIAAFDRASDAGVWGLELDLRWTADLVPVVIHDPDLERVFQDRRYVHHMTFEELQAGFGEIPFLAEVVARYGGRRHLMIELKQSNWPDPAAQNRTLHQILAPLEPARDYHFISIDPDLLALMADIPGLALIPIAYGLPVKLYHQVLAGRWGGLCGHYTLMGNSLVRGLKSRGKAVGTGYAASSNCLFRELRRGIDWIFSNNAAELQQMINAWLEEEPK